MQSVTFPDTPHNPPPIWTVDGITQEIKDRIEPEFMGIWVEGEVVTLRPASSGHVYFSLSGKNAFLSCALFRGDARRLTVPLREGDQVACFGSVEVYPPSGRYQLIVRRVKRSGEGELLAKLEALKKTLRAEGLFDDERKRPLPTYPRRVGVITSPTGAAIRDIVRSIHDRYPAPILLAPAPVQGAQAPAALLRALNQLAAVDDVDVIIIGRGGGSIEDLWAFNDETLARGIAQCPKVVVSAVGHEIDFALTDFVADARAATPTHAGVLVVPDRNELVNRLQQQQRRAIAGLVQRVQRARNQLDMVRLQLTEPSRLIREHWQRVDVLEQRLKRTARMHPERGRHRLNICEQKLRILDPKDRLMRERAAMIAMRRRIDRSWERVVQQWRSRLRTADASLRALGPLSAMERGYAIVRRTEDKRVVRSAHDLQYDDNIEVLLRNGTVEAAVRAIHTGENAS